MKTTTALLTLAFGLSAYTTLAQPQPQGDSAPGPRQARMEGLGRRAGGPPPWAGMGQRRPEGERPMGRQFNNQRERSAGPEFGYGMRNRARGNSSIERPNPRTRGIGAEPGTKQGMQRQRQNRMEGRPMARDRFDRPERGQGAQAVSPRGSGRYAPRMRGQATEGSQRPGAGMRGQRGPRAGAQQAPEGDVQSPTLRNRQGAGWQQRERAGGPGRGPGQFRRGANRTWNNGANQARGPRGGWNRSNNVDAPNGESLPQPPRRRSEQAQPRGDQPDQG